MNDTLLAPVPAYFFQTCERFPQRPAQRFNPALYHGDHQGTLSYAQLLDRVETLACGLLDLGLHHQERAAIMAPSGPHWTQADLALSAIGAASVAVFPTLSQAEVRHILRDSDCRFLFVGDEGILHQVQSVRQELPRLEKIIVLDLGFRGSGDVMGLSELLERGRGAEPRLAPELSRRREAIGLDDVFTILYTSGTTGISKGVLLSHGTAAERYLHVKAFLREHEMEITERDVTLCFLPLSHIFDRGSCQILALCEGACIAYADKPATLLADLQRYQPSWFNCVPRVYEKIYLAFQEKMRQSPLKKRLFDWALGVGRRAFAYRTDAQGHVNMAPSFKLKAALPLGLRLRFMIADRLFAKVRALFGPRFRMSFSASAGIAPDLLAFFYSLGLPVVEGYGSTESFNACILNPLDACKPGRVGVAAVGTRARIAADGELELSGPGMFRGYLHAEDTAAAFTADGWFMTGDLVERDADGYFRIVDRKKAILCTSVGKNIAPAKLEARFATSLPVDQAFFVGDERPFIAALLVPNFNYFIERFEREGIRYDQSQLKFSTATGMSLCMEVGEDFVAQPLLRERIAAEVAAANETLEGFEAIRRYHICRHRFSEENGQLTPTQKAKKRVLLKDYAAEIEAMYREEPGS